MNRLICVFLSVFFLVLPLTVSAEEVLPAAELSVAERNALQGFNDTIDRLAPDFVTVSLMVADPTDQSQDYLGITGHAFLRLQCPTFNLDYCFSYESEKIKGQLWDYLTGKLHMGMYAIPTNDYVADYRRWKRAVHEYHLNLPPEAEQRLWEQMDNHMAAERGVQMDLFKFGCTNTILRYVERSLSPTQITYNWPDKYNSMTAMEIAEEHLSGYPWTSLFFRLTARKSLDGLRSPKQKVIFPPDLLEVWSSATINGEPMLAYVGDVVQAEPVQPRRTWFTPAVCGIILLVLLGGCITGIILRKRKK